MLKVSVVIPTYNRAKLVVETIHSVLAQTFADFEIIVVDDGSTDNTKEVVESLKNSSIRYMYQENRGVSAARNKGIKLSTSEYITFLDADDILVENSIEKRVEFLDKHPEAALCYSQIGMMDESGYVYRIKKSSFVDHSSIIDGGKLVKELLFKCNIFPSSAMIRRSCLDDVGGFHEGMRFGGEDIHLFIRLAKRYQLAYIAETLVKYRVHSEQLSRIGSPEVFERIVLLILKEVFEDKNIAPQFEYLKGQAYSHYYNWVAGIAYGGNMRLARHYFRKAISYYPWVIIHKEGLLITYKYLASLLPNHVRRGLRSLKWRLRPPSIADLKE